MTPQEFDRRMEFITETLANLSVKQDREREERVEVNRQHTERLRRHDESIRLLTELIEIQSSRMDRFDGFAIDAQKRHEEFMKRWAQEHAEQIARLDRILDRLSERN